MDMKTIRTISSDLSPYRQTRPFYPIRDIKTCDLTATLNRFCPFLAQTYKKKKAELHDVTAKER